MKVTRCVIGNNAGDDATIRFSRTMTQNDVCKMIENKEVRIVFSEDTEDDVVVNFGLVCVAHSFEEVDEDG